MPHIEPGFYIDRAKIGEFAEIKIKNAKVLKIMIKVCKD